MSQNNNLLLTQWSYKQDSIVVTGDKILRVRKKKKNDMDGCTRFQLKK